MGFAVRPRFFLFASVALIACNSADSPPNGQQPALQAPPAAQASPDVAGVNRVLDPLQFADPRVRQAYQAAKEYAHVLESIYCYCRCKENINHRALVECFESDHGAHCDVCMNEAIIAARMTKDGKTPTEIQKAIDAYYAG